MSYDTKFSLKISHEFLSETEIIKELRESSPAAAFALGESGETADKCSWYNHEDDLRYFSKKYPAVIFVLDGYGDEKDIWRKYIKDGRVQYVKAEILFPSFDEIRLA